MNAEPEDFETVRIAEARACAMNTMRTSGVAWARALAAKQLRIYHPRLSETRWGELRRYWRAYARATRGFKCVPDSWVSTMIKDECI